MKTEKGQKQKIALAIVDDHQIVIDGIKSLLKGLDNFNVVIELVFIVLSPAPSTRQTRTLVT